MRPSRMGYVIPTPAPILTKIENKSNLKLDENPSDVELDPTLIQSSPLSRSSLPLVKLEDLSETMIPTETAETEPNTFGDAKYQENDINPSDVDLEPSTLFPSPIKVEGGSKNASMVDLDETKNHSSDESNDIRPVSSNVGRLELTVKFDEPDQFLDVIIRQAENLSVTKNTYVKIKFDPSNKKFKLNSKVVNKSSDPVWDENFEIDLEDVTFPEDVDLSMVIEVWSKGFIKSSYIGSLVFSMEVVQKNVIDGWFDLTKSFSNTDLQKLIKRRIIFFVSSNNYFQVRFL